MELTDNPDSYMLLFDNDEDGLPDPATEIRVPLHKGARFVVDTQRLWHVVVHTGDAPRYALITSFESGPALDAVHRCEHAGPGRRLTATRFPTERRRIPLLRKMKRHWQRWDVAMSAMSRMIFAISKSFGV